MLARRGRILFRMRNKICRRQLDEIEQEAVHRPACRHAVAGITRTVGMNRLTQGIGYLPGKGHRIDVHHGIARHAADLIHHKIRPLHPLHQ